MGNENNECCIKQRTRAHSDSPARAWLARIRMAKTETDLNATHFMRVFVCLRFWLFSSIFLPIWLRTVMFGCPTHANNKQNKTKTHIATRKILSTIAGSHFNRVYETNEIGLWPHGKLNSLWMIDSHLGSNQSRHCSVHGWKTSITRIACTESHTER